MKHVLQGLVHLIFPKDIWSSFFEVLSRPRCSLSSFFHSIRLLPCGEQGLRQPSGRPPTGQVWPIPLPFPMLLKPGFEGIVIPPSWDSML